MRSIPKTALALLAVLVSTGCGRDANQAPSAPAMTYVTIGTGDITGLYYPVGGAIAKIVNVRKEVHHVRCAVESTAGSVYNVKAVLGGNLEFGIVQSDHQFQAIKGQGEWQAEGPQERLRACFSLHSESVTLVAASDAGINDIADLRGKRVNIGNPGSGQRQNAIDALMAVGLDPARDIIAEGAKASAAPGLLQDGRIDAFFYTVGHPNGAIKEAVSGARRVRLASMNGIEALIADRPYYTRSRIAIKHYKGLENTADVETFGVKATVVTAAEVPEHVVYAVVKEVFENLESLKTMHTATEDLTREGMLEGLSAAFHPGALKYYREAGLVK
jgi:TRAP transporter TAXI family solute receptor